MDIIKEMQLKIDESKAPNPDMGECLECDWKGYLNECGQEEDGSWEEGYYRVHICPKCGEGVDYTMSEEQAELYHIWWEKNKK